MAIPVKRLPKSYDHKILIMDSFRWIQPPKTTFLTTYDLNFHIEEYSKRNLSQDCDSLNAFLGILRYYESNVVDDYDGPTYQLWGIPLRLPMNHRLGEVDIYLLWNREFIAQRREDQPSWSWSGWGGPIQFLLPNVNIRSLPTEDHGHDREVKFGDGAVKRVLQISIPCGGKAIDLYSFIRKRQSNILRGVDPKELHITSFVVPLRFRTVDTCQATWRDRWRWKWNWRIPPPKVISTFAIRPGVFLDCPVYFDREYDPESHKLGMALPDTGRFYPADEPCEVFPDTTHFSFIVLHPVADGKYERAGIVSLFDDEHDDSISNDFDSRFIYFDEQDPRKGRPSNNLYFLRDAKWRTVCLV